MALRPWTAGSSRPFAPVLHATRDITMQAGRALPAEQVCLRGRPDRSMEIFEGQLDHPGEEDLCIASPAH